MFSAAELSYMRNTQESHMMDTCVIYHVTSKTKDRRGQYVKTFGDPVTTICGVQMDVMDMGGSDNVRTADVDIVLRLPLGTVVEPQDEIEITKRFGESVTVRRYEVQRYTNDGPSGCRAYLKVRTVQ